MALISINQPPYVTLGTKNEYFSSVSTCVKLFISGPGTYPGGISKVGVISAARPTKAHGVIP